MNYFLVILVSQGNNKLVGNFGIMSDKRRWLKGNTLDIVAFVMKIGDHENKFGEPCFKLYQSIAKQNYTLKFII